METFSRFFLFNVKMKLALRLLTFYVIFFATLSTFLMLHIFRNISFTNSQFVLQNIICNDGPKESVVNGNIFIKEITKQPPVTYDDTNDLHEVIKSLKHDIYSTRYKNAAWFATSRRSQIYQLNIRPLSIYNGQDFNAMLSLFPVKSQRPSDDRIISQLNMNLRFKSPKLVLLASTNIDLSEKDFLASDCNIKHCHFTKNISLVENADAIIFGGTPNIIKTPKSREKQVWVYYDIESPVHNIEYKTSMKMNWTATYRSNSVIPTPYGKFVPFRGVQKLPVKPVRNFATGKSNLAAIFVSNCQSKNGRLDYVKELKKFASIHVFGRCGDMSCEKSSDNCFEMLKRGYKFYLAFENSNCRDYITEKFFYNALQNDVIPIVMGAHPDDYKKVAPPNSFIHVDEFNSPRQLAEYMHILDNNDELYNEYFRWKETGTFINTKFACRLCSMLQIAPNFPSRDFDVMDMQDRSKKECIIPSMSEKWTKWKLVS